MMNPSTNNILSIETLSLTTKPETFQGISDSGEVKKILNSDGVPCKSTTGLGHKVKKVAKRVEILINPNNKTTNEKKEVFQRKISQLRATAIKEKDVEKLLQIPSECSSDKDNKVKEWIKPEKLRTQVKIDAKKLLINKIRETRTPKDLDKIHKTIEKLHLEEKINKGMKSNLQKEVDGICSQAAKQLEAKIEEELTDVTPEIAVQIKCQCITDWSKAIKEVSQRSFEKHSKQLMQLTINTYTSGISQVKPHESDLRITLHREQSIGTLSKQLEHTLKNTFEKTEKTLVQFYNTRDRCLEPLQKELRLVPELVREIITINKKLIDISNKEKELENNNENLNDQLHSTGNNIDNRRNRKKKSILGKSKFLRRFDPMYQKRQKKTKKIKENLSTRLDEARENLDKLESRKEFHKLTLSDRSQKLTSAIEKYGNSIKALPEFKNIENPEDSPTVEQLIDAIENKGSAVLKDDSFPEANKPGDKANINSGGSAASTMKDNIPPQYKLAQTTGKQSKPKRQAPKPPVNTSNNAPQKNALPETPHADKRTKPIKTQELPRPNTPPPPPPAPPPPPVPVTASRETKVPITGSVTFKGGSSSEASKTGVEASKKPDSSETSTSKGNIAPKTHGALSDKLREEIHKGKKLKKVAEASSNNKPQGKETNGLTHALMNNPRFQAVIQANQKTNNHNNNEDDEQGW